jgi:hypothetical protein
MQGFKFRMQRVLQWQVKMCHLEEEGTRLCRLAVTEGEERIAQLRAEALAAEQDVLGHQAIAASDLIALARYRAQVAGRGRDLEARRQAVLAALEEQLRKLEVARRQLQRIETFRDRSLLEHNLTLNRELEALALECHLSRWVTARVRQDAECAGMNRRGVVNGRVATEKA